MVKVLNVLLFLTIYSATFAQLVEVPIAHHTRQSARGNPAARIQASSLILPFWDDFSYADSLTYPQTSLWQFGESVFLNSGTGIKPPTKNVVTFDGIDSVGKPYNVNDRLAKGFADRLVSNPIRMDLVDPALRTTVYLSFFYQVQGLGESPDDGDQLVVLFKNISGTWETITTLENNNPSIQTNVFYQILIPVVGDQFYHTEFQFCIQNFARLSGPYDAWNVDYVYLNSGRSTTDTSFPDRAVSSIPNSLFKTYFAIPYKHFKENPANNLKHPALDLYNLRDGNLQPFNYTTDAIFTTYKNNSSTTSAVSLDVAQDPGAPLTGLQYFNLTLNQIPTPAAFDITADSVEILFRYRMATKDNVAIPPIDNGDYDPVRYSPIDFRVNDKVNVHYQLFNYYAYDDGVAEYGAGLNQAGSYASFQFPLAFSQPDTLLAVDIYFPEFGDNSSQSLMLQIRTDLSDVPSSILYQQLIVVNRGTQRDSIVAGFTRYKLNQFVVVKDTIYVGWKQLTNVTLPVGLDKNTDNGDKIFYNTNGNWLQNTTVKGSVMVRPVFGHGIGEGVVTQAEQEIVPPVYPNPTSRICYLPQGAEHVSVFDITGRNIEIELQPFTDRTSLTFLSPVSSLAIVHYFLRGKQHTEKIMVRPE